jgi:hypothetical protein
MTEIATTAPGAVIVDRAPQLQVTFNPQRR